MQKSRYDLWVGLFVVIGAAAILFLALKAGNLLSLSFDKGYRVDARFDNIGGLKVRAPVKSAGVTIGRVAAIALDTSSYQGTVTTELEQGIAFPTDTSAKILTAGLLGDQYIGLEAGGSEQNLKPGDQIRMTQSAVVLENLIGQFLYSKAAEPGGEQK
jgi:phospholipid/cholesterol/gamma-HCH transport system substrate-binding protein